MKTMSALCKIIFATLLTYIFSLTTLYSQNDTMYIMKGGAVVGKYNVNTQIDSIIFYIPVLANTVTDYDGNVYNTVTIGTQVWMAENLKTTHYADGTAIPLVTGNSNWDTLTSTSKAYCWYNNDTTNKITYGALYTWAAAMNGAESSNNNPSGIQGVCPTGWHLPSAAEWTQLSTYLGGIGVAGGKLKETDTIHWLSPNTEATNEVGFTALPGGNRGDNGTFDLIRQYGLWWTATEFDDLNAYYRRLNYFNANVYINNYYKMVGFSVRCLKD